MVSAPANKRTTHHRQFDPKRRHLAAVAEPRELSLPDLLAVLGYTEGEFTSLSDDRTDSFPSRVVGLPDVGAALVKLPAGTNQFFGVNSIRGPARRGRGKTEDITRLAALIADLDFKSTGCGSVETAHAIIDDLSVIVGTRPSAITSSGGGLHPIWPIIDGQIGKAFPVTQATALLNRWAVAVRSVAAKRGAKVDSVFDLPRVLRAPGTRNWKTNPPLAATCVSDSGRALTVSEVNAALALTVPTAPTDRAVGSTGVVTSTPHSQGFGESTCAYVRRWLDGLSTDGPNGSGRHQWVGSEAVRFGCAKRAGCISETDYVQARKAVEHRLIDLRADTKETVPATEVRSWWRAGLKKANSKTDAEVAAELGNHTHVPGQAYFTDAGLAEVVAAEVLTGSFLKSTVGPWHQWSGMVWQSCTDGPPTEAIRKFVLEKIKELARKLADEPGNQNHLVSRDSVSFT